jgi:hypothetical protein
VEGYSISRPMSLRLRTPLAGALVAGDKSKKLRVNRNDNDTEWFSRKALARRPCIAVRQHGRETGNFMGSPDTSIPTTDRLRAEIDSGRTGDKVAASDPAAAPLGADDEAAGKPPSRRSVERAGQMEIKVPHASEGRQRGLGSAWILIGFTGFLGAALIVWGAMRLL